MPSLLIVDDSPTSRAALVELLTEEGYQCTAVADGRAALARVRSRLDDLVLLDITMPDVTGLEVLAEIRHHRSAVELPVIMVTARAGSHSVISALESGANDYVTKPVDFPTLLARVHTQLRIQELSRLKDEFLSIASHDLKNPLNVVLSALQAIASKFPVEAPMTAEGRWLLETAIRRSRQMTRLITEFLDQDAADQGRLRLRRVPTDLRSIAERVVEDNRLYAQQKRLELKLPTAAPLPLVPADEARLAQVLDNLLGNAIKFGPPGGRIAVEICGDETQVRVEVRDTGPGLAEDDLEGLFLKYAPGCNRPTSSESSTGLGLAWCKHIIELHGGRIGAFNNVPSGAVFWFELPIASP